MHNIGRVTTVVRGQGAQYIRGKMHRYRNREDGRKQLSKAFDVNPVNGAAMGARDVFPSGGGQEHTPILSPRREPAAWSRKCAIGCSSY